MENLISMDLDWGYPHHELETSMKKAPSQHCNLRPHLPHLPGRVIAAHQGVEDKVAEPQTPEALEFVEQRASKCGPMFSEPILWRSLRWTEPINHPQYHQKWPP